jgi:hypothetical protein
MISKLKGLAHNIHKITDIEKHLQEQLMITQANSQIIQKQIFCQLQSERIKRTPPIKDIGFSLFSQFDEDGIILCIFALVGFTNKFCLDIAFANPFGANTTNLLLNWGFHGLLICGDENERIYSETFFKNNRSTWLLPPKIIDKWVTIENIKDILLQNNVPRVIDFFSLDMDGVDYYICQEVLKTIQPRVMVVEAHSIWKTERSVTVRYSSDFNRFKIHKDYCSASIPAFVKLMKINGYKLVACNKYSFNLFFIKENEDEDLLPEIKAEDCIARLPSYYIVELDRRRKDVENLDWVEV